jgi:hypothetical protein
MYQDALRKKFRYPTNRGDITTEQLFDLPLQSKTGFDLDTTAKAINRQLREVEDDSFVNTGANPVKAELEAKLAVVVDVIKTKQAENEAARKAAARKAELDTLTEALHDAKKAEILKLSPAELEARIKALSEG